MNNKYYKRGLRNDYRGDMPFAERIAKDLKELFSDFNAWLGNGFKLRVIVVWPDFPSKRTTIFKIAKRLGCRITNHFTHKPDLILYFDDATTGDAGALSAEYPGIPIWNITCTDISKKKVDQIHLDVFGYNTFVDPENYSGNAVLKSDVNALHDGEIIRCPIKLNKDGSKIVQVLIDNSFDENFVMDYRVPVIQGEIPHVYRKFKRYDVRFTNDVSHSDLQETNAMFSQNEIEHICSFVKKMGADFCELDVLRNKDDGRIYIIDLNKTPYGPPFGLSSSDAEKALSNLTELISRAMKSNL